MKSSPKDFCNLLSLVPHRNFIVILLKDFFRWLLGDSIGIVKSRANSDENLALLRISFTWNMSSKNVASRDSKIVSTCISGTSDFTTKNL
jgi:hypothetical protein